MKKACWLVVLMLGLFTSVNAQNLFVINYGGSYPNFTIEKFNSNGVGQVFATASSGNFFTCLAFDSNGNLYVGQGGAGGGTILEFNSSGAARVFASTGLVASPSGLAFDSSGNLYVANYNGNNIDKFNSSGGGSVFASSGLNGPIGLVFDNNTNLYVSNWGTTTIDKFNSSGSITTFVNSGPPFGSLDGPMGLAYDNHGNLFVANYENNTVEEATGFAVCLLRSWEATFLAHPVYHITIGVDSVLVTEMLVSDSILNLRVATLLRLGSSHQ